MKVTLFELRGLAWMACEGKTWHKASDFDLLSRNELIDLIEEHLPDLLEGIEV